VDCLDLARLHDVAREERDDEQHDQYRERPRCEYLLLSCLWGFFCVGASVLGRSRACARWRELTIWVCIDGISLCRSSQQTARKSPCRLLGAYSAIGP
jgi:hypothetical protein